MIGTMRWNLIGAGIGLLLTFVLSMNSNVFTTSLIRSLYTFAFLFILIFVIRFVLGTLLTSQPSSGDNVHQSVHKGQHFDAVTPDQTDDLNDLLKEDRKIDENSEGFQPLEPPQLLNKNKLQPDELAKAIRHLNEE